MSIIPKVLFAGIALAAVVAIGFKVTDDQSTALAVNGSSSSALTGSPQSNGTSTSAQTESTSPVKGREPTFTVETSALVAKQGNQGSAVAPLLLAKRDLRSAYDEVMASSSPGSGAAALQIVSICLNYASANKPFLPELSSEYISRLASTANSAEIVKIRRNAAAKELQRQCSGFDSSALGSLAKAAHEKNLAQGFGFLSPQFGKSPRKEELDAAVNRLIDWPDRYVSVLAVNSTWLNGVVTRAADAQLSPQENSVVTELMLCGLGSDCTADGITSLNFCAMSAACDGPLDNRLLSAASAQGFDANNLLRISQSLVADVRRGDRRALKLN